MMIENEQTNKDVTEFLGIPVDGDPYSMRQKLIEKGFKFIDDSDEDDDPRRGGDLTGIFNNEQVYITIQKNPNTGKVWRIFVSNQNKYSKDEAIRKFNNLVTQFDAKANYTRANEDPNTYYIPDDVNDANFDINYEKPKYQATYYQGNDIMNSVWFRIIKKDKNSDNYRIMIFYENRYNKPKELKSNNDVTKFLGIPVDGSPESMRQKLIEKGFEFIPGSDKNYGPMIGGELTGIFNNEEVKIIIEKNPHTGKVWRIFVFPQNNYSKSKAIRKYNNLVTQFDAKANYTRIEYSVYTYYIPDDVNDANFDINYEKPKYQAHYYQGNSIMKPVWFMIWKDKDSDKYDIMIFYENRYNKPKPGEDL